MNYQTIAPAIRKVMEQKGLHPLIIEEFLRRTERVAQGDSGKIPWNEIEELKDSDRIRYDEREQAPENYKSIADKLAVIKLNGGLGTSMGLDRAKSLIPVKGDRNFLSIIMGQIHKLRESTHVNIPLLFMNSFNTQEDTLLEKGMKNINSGCKGNLPPDFVQNQIPRICADSGLPFGDGSRASHWCPPGHGDIYLSLQITNILDVLLSGGYRIAFISNGDNLGATADLAILDMVLDRKLDFAMEITPKTKADLKGGVLFRRRQKDGTTKIELLEIAQVEDEHTAQFQDLSKFAHFNTNNLWIHLESLRDQLKKGLPLALIVNPKSVDGQNVLQLETAMGSAIGHFSQTAGIVVDRNRFAPVKSCADLLVRRSDAYILGNSDDRLYLDPALKAEGEPVITLDDFYKKMSGYEKSIRITPSLRGCRELNIRGKVIFDVPMTIQGKVTIQNQSSDAKPISKIGKTVLKNEEVQF